MKKIPLRGKHGEGKYTLVDDVDYGKVSRYKWHVLKRNNTDIEYAIRSVYDPKTQKTVSQKMHRFILGIKADGKHIDHINRDGLDNRRSNLRAVSRFENMQNSKDRAGVSDYKGVSYDKKNRKWKAEITYRNKVYRGGYYESEVDAAHAYDVLARMYHQEYRKCNFDNPPAKIEGKVKRLLVSQNNRKNTSGFRGVSWRSDKGKWRAYIGHNYAYVHLGHFLTEQEAALAYNAKAVELFGEHAFLNKV